MRLTYKFAFDTAYCKAVIAHYYRQRPLLVRLPVQFSVLAIIAAVIWAAWRKMDISDLKPTTLALAGVITAGSVVVLTEAVKFSVLRKLKRSGEFGTEVTLSLSDEGLAASSRYGARTVVWSAYPRAVRFSDGILLVRGGSVRWLPDSALQGSSPEQATSLVGSKTNLRAVRIPRPRAAP